MGFVTGTQVKSTQPPYLALSLDLLENDNSTYFMWINNYVFQSTGTELAMNNMDKFC